MKKKILSLALVAAMVMGMATSVCAANSPSAKGSVSKAVDANGNTIEATVTATSQPAPTTTELKTILGSAFNENMTVATICDIKVPDGTTFPVTLTISAPGATSKTVGKVLHFNGSSWDVISGTFGKDCVTAKFDSLSPVAVVVDKTTTNTTSTDSTTSPKTGETATSAMVAAFAAVAALGCAVVVRRKRA